jgi:hypothetical protein
MRFALSTLGAAGRQRRHLVALITLVSAGFLALAGGHGAAQDVLTNDGVVKMVKAGLPESVIVQKIRTSEKKFDTSADALIKLKGAGVPDRVIEAMVGEPAAPPAAAAPAAAPEPVIAHVIPSGEKKLKPVLGSYEAHIEPFGGARQEFVLQAPKAEYRIADREPVFATPQPGEQWILARLKPGKRDRNLPISKGGAWFVGMAFQGGVDPKYVIKLSAEPGSNGGFRLKPAQPLAPGEYGFVTTTRNQMNVVEVFDFGVD